MQGESSGGDMLSQWAVQSRWRAGCSVTVSKCDARLLLYYKARLRCYHDTEANYSSVSFHDCGDLGSGGRQWYNGLTHDPQTHDLQTKCNTYL